MLDSFHHIFKIAGYFRIVFAVKHHFLSEKYKMYYKASQLILRN